MPSHDRAEDASKKVSVGGRTWTVGQRSFFPEIQVFQWFT